MWTKTCIWNRHLYPCYQLSDAVFISHITMLFSSGIWARFIYMKKTLGSMADVFLSPRGLGTHHRVLRSLCHNDLRLPFVKFYGTTGTTFFVLDIFLIQKNNVFFVPTIISIIYFEAVLTFRLGCDMKLCLKQSSVHTNYS